MRECPQQLPPKGDLEPERDPLYRQARRRVQAIKGFYVHASAYVLINMLMFVIDMATGSSIWFIYPMVGWGIALALHAVVTFGLGVFSRDWEERKILELMERERQRSQR